MIRIYICIFGSILQIHKCVHMSKDQCSLQRFGEVVTGHFLCWAVFDAEFLLFDAVSDLKISHVNETGFIFTRILPVPLHKDDALFILVCDIFKSLTASNRRNSASNTAQGNATSR